MLYFLIMQSFNFFLFLSTFMHVVFTCLKKAHIFLFNGIPWPFYWFGNNQLINQSDQLLFTTALFFVIYPSLNPFISIEGMLIGECTNFLGLCKEIGFSWKVFLGSRKGVSLVDNSDNLFLIFIFLPFNVLKSFFNLYFSIC